MVEQVNDLADINSVSTTSWLPSRYPDRACTIKEQQQQVQLVRAHRLKNLLTTSTYSQLFRLVLSLIECIVFIVVLAKRDINLSRQANCKTPLVTISMLLFFSVLSFIRQWLLCASRYSTKFDFFERIVYFNMPGKIVSWLTLCKLMLHLQIILDLPSATHECRQTLQYGWMVKVFIFGWFYIGFGLLFALQFFKLPQYQPESWLLKLVQKSTIFSSWYQPAGGLSTALMNTTTTNNNGNNNTNPMNVASARGKFSLTFTRNTYFYTNNINSSSSTNNNNNNNNQTIRNPYGSGADDNWSSSSQQQNIPSGVLYQDQHEDCNPQCLLCSNHYLTGEGITRLRCGHDFHTECGEPWLLISEHCPACYISIDPLRVPCHQFDDFHPITPKQFMNANPHDIANGTHIPGYNGGNNNNNNNNDNNNNINNPYGNQQYPTQYGSYGSIGQDAV